MSAKFAFFTATDRNYFPGTLTEGAGQFVYRKTVIDSVGRMAGSYFGYNTTASIPYATVTTISSSDTVFEQSIPVYDNGGNVLYTTSYQRWNDGTGTGALTSSNARLSYTAAFYDGISRPVASINYGAASSFTPPTSIPASSDTVLVSAVSYNAAGEAFSQTDPKGIVAQQRRDNAGRLTVQVNDYGGLAQTTQWTYTPDGQIATLTAVNASTGNQITTYAVH